MWMKMSGSATGWKRVSHKAKIHLCDGMGSQNTFQNNAILKIPISIYLQHLWQLIFFQLLELLLRSCISSATRLHSPSENAIVKVPHTAAAFETQFGS